MNTPEYYVVGRDTPESLCDSALSASPRQRLSFLFGGIGDARNLFQTIIEVAAHERDSKRKETYKDYHFTIVDIKSVTIARNLVILMLLDELSKLVHDTARAKSSKILLCIFYTHLSLIMPNSLLEVLQRKLGKQEPRWRRAHCRCSLISQTRVVQKLLDVLTTGNAKFSRNFPSLVCGVELFECASCRNWNLQFTTSPPTRCV
jgi:hypothetical protein